MGGEVGARVFDMQVRAGILVGPLDVAAEELRTLDHRWLDFDGVDTLEAGITQ